MVATAGERVPPCQFPARGRECLFAVDARPAARAGGGSRRSVCDLWRKRGGGLGGERGVQWRRQRGSVGGGVWIRGRAARVLLGGPAQGAGAVAGPVAAAAGGAESRDW